MTLVAMPKEYEALGDPREDFMERWRVEGEREEDRRGGWTA